MTISRDSRIPLYIQIRHELEQEILDKKFEPGERLPSEDELADRFEVSRMTARRAIDQLVSQGLLKRIQGQGTFVVKQAPRPKAVGITRWAFERIEQSHPLRSRLLEVEETTPSLTVANALHAMPGEPIVQLTRGLYVDSEPLGYRIDRIPKLFVATVEAWNLAERTLPDFLADHSGLEFGRVVERVRPVTAEEEAVQLLAVEPDTPLLYVNSLLFLASGIPAILAETFYRSDRYVYHGILHPLPQGQAE